MAGCFTVMVLSSTPVPLTVMIAVRSDAPELAGAVSVTVPSFEPDAGAIVSHDEALLLTAQLFVFDMMVNDCSPPASGKVIELVEMDISTGTSVTLSQPAYKSPNIRNILIIRLNTQSGRVTLEIIFDNVF
jgi:hypothetical protein